VRNLLNDLEICCKATPGKWYLGGQQPIKPGWELMDHMDTPDYVCIQYNEDEKTMVTSKISYLEGRSYSIEDSKLIKDMQYWRIPIKANAEFIAEAREGWPYAIEQALKLRKALDAALDVIQMCKNKTIRSYTLENALAELNIESPIGGR